jgi:DNA-directed RNA polymerase beta' subunit
VRACAWRANNRFRGGGSRSARVAMMFRYSDADVKKVRKVQFGILGPEELKAASVCKITTDRTFEHGKAVPGGLMDLALGAIDRLIPCGSCGMDEQECPGHFGHLELVKPMYHISFLNTTIKLLRCVCFSCSEILGDEPAEDGERTKDSQRMIAATRKKSPVQRLRAVMDICRTKKTCWACSAPQPNFKRDGLMIQAEFAEATDVRACPVPSRTPSLLSLCAYMHAKCITALRCHICTQYGVDAHLAHHLRPRTHAPLLSFYPHPARAP